MVAKTDGVPLFVEELTKMVLESGLLEEVNGRYELTRPLPPLAIPATLHDSLMARLNGLATVKTVAQLGATIGRTFTYELLHAVAFLDEATLQHGLPEPVEAELAISVARVPRSRICSSTRSSRTRPINPSCKEKKIRTTCALRRWWRRSSPRRQRRNPNCSPITTPKRVATPRLCPTGKKAAIGRSAYREAAACFEQALEALQQLPGGREAPVEAIDLRLHLRNVLLPLGEQERILDHLRVAATLAEAVQDQPRLGLVTQDDQLLL